MNKKMREIKNKIVKLNEEARAFVDGKEMEKATATLREIDALKNEYDVQRQIFENEAETLSAQTPINSEKLKPNGFEAMAKAIKRAPLTESENALITGGESGENYLIPEDVDLQIRELRKEYKSAKGLVTVIKTTSLSGGFNFEKGLPTGLDSLSDGDDISATGEPKFERKSFAIKLFGKLIPVSNVLIGAEKAGLVATIKKWFVKNAVLSENKAIFEKLKEGKTAKVLKGLSALKSSLNKDLDPSVLIGAKIVTNQTGFDIMDSETDKNGRPLLQPNPIDPTLKMLGGINIEVFSDAELPNVAGKAPIFYGRTDDGCYFIEKDSLEFAVSDQYLFNKNQTVFRVIEGFDAIQADTSAYIYATFEQVAAAA